MINKVAIFRAGRYAGVKKKVEEMQNWCKIRKTPCLPVITYVKIQAKHISYEFSGFKPSIIYFISEVYAFPKSSRKAEAADMEGSLRKRR